MAKELAPHKQDTATYTKSGHTLVMGKGDVGTTLHALYVAKEPAHKKKTALRKRNRVTHLAMEKGGYRSVGCRRRLNSGLDNRKEFRRRETRTANEEAVDVALCEQIRGVGLLHGA